MSKKTDNYAAMAMANGLQYDAANNVIYGQKDGYDLLIYAENSGSYPYIMTINTSARRGTGGALSKDEIKELIRSPKALSNASQDGNTIKAIMFAKANAKQDMLKNALSECLSSLISFLNAKGFQPCCSMCGQYTEIAGFKAGLTYMHLCPECESQARNNTMTIADKQNRPENVVGGIIGAFLGSLLGVVLIILLGRMGYVAAVSGAVMGFGVLKGYELLGGNLSKKGVVISVVIMLIMTYVGSRLDLAIEVYKELGDYGFSYFDCFRRIPDFIEIGAIERDTYIYNLVLLYVFLLLGAVPTIRTKVQERTASGRMVRIGHMNNYNM